MPSILQSQFTEKGFQKTENVEHNWVSVVLFCFCCCCCFCGFIYPSEYCTIGESVQSWKCTVFFIVQSFTDCQQTFKVYTIFYLYRTLLKVMYGLETLA